MLRTIHESKETHAIDIKFGCTFLQQAIITETVQFVRIDGRSGYHPDLQQEDDLLASEPIIDIEIEGNEGSNFILERLILSAYENGHHELDLSDLIPA